MPHLDTDQIAALVIVYGTAAEQAQMQQQIRIYRGELCPECDAEDAEDNGATGRDLGFRCCACDHRWDAADVEVEVPAALSDADFDADLMFPTPAPTPNKRDARVAATTNRRGW